MVCYTPEQCVYPVNWAAADDHARERSVRYFERSVEITAGRACRRVKVVVAPRGGATRSGGEIDLATLVTY